MFAKSGLVEKVFNKRGSGVGGAKYYTKGYVNT